MKIQIKLRTKLIIAFSSVTFFMAFILMGSTHHFFDSIFGSNYEGDSHTLAVNTIANSLSNNQGKIDPLSERQLGWLCDLYSLDMTIYGPSDEVLLDISKCKDPKHLFEWRSNEKHYITYPLSIETKELGYVAFSFYGDHFLESENFHSVWEGMVHIAISGVVLTILLGFYLAHRVSKPLQSITHTAGDLSKGQLASRSKVRSSTFEIAELSSAINHLGHSLEDQEFLRKRLTADISHELRTPLNILRNQIEAMIDDIFKADNHRLQILLNEVERLTHMVFDLEKLTNLDENDNALIINRFSMTDLMKEVMLQMEPEMHKKNIQCHLRLADIYYNGDYSRLKQVFINLITNAVKFTPNNGNINLLLQNQEHTLKITVTDDGIGIPEKDLPYVFERFYRAENSRNRNTGGAGLGLSIVRKIVEAHQGTISIINNKEKGITVQIELPLSE